MPNSVKYSTTTPLNSLRKGNVAIGVNDVDMGPTTSTGWYNGVTPILGNYVIYKTAATGDPDVFAPQSDQELYNFVIMQGGNSSNTTSVGAALAWIATQSDLFAVNNTLPNIVTDGLILNLDASLVCSYPTTGTTWYDISGANNNGQMLNGLSFNAGGWMDFDGVDDYIWIPNNNGTMDAWSEQQTIIVWEYHDFTTGRRNIWNQAYGGFGTWTHENGSNINYYFGDSGANAQPYTSGNSQTTVRGQWNMLCVTRDLTTVNWYQNGVLTSTRNNPFGSLTNTTAGVSIGTGYTGLYWQGKMSKIQAYTRALTATEVFQNYIGEGNWVVDGDYLKIFRHYSGTGEFFSSSNNWEEAKRSNPSDPQANKYSILDRVKDFLIGGTYTFKLYYPQLGITNIWSQTNNPVTGNGSGGVTDYTAISIGSSSNGWGGLERYDVQTSTFLDGTLIPQSNWYYAVGVKNPWGGPTTFPGPSSAVNEVELWIKYK
jgi:hypothetical protein